MIQVILAFAGSGKSTLAQQLSGKRLVVDLDSGKYSKEEDFPYNYLAKLKSIIEHSPNAIVLMSTHRDVVKMLRDRSIPHLYVYPECEWEVWSKRYTDRNDPPSFINMMESRWAEFQKDFETTPNDSTTIKIGLKGNEYLHVGMLDVQPIATW